jgi:hypothetical protein
MMGALLGGMGAGAMPGMMGMQGMQQTSFGPQQIQAAMAAGMPMATIMQLMQGGYAGQAGGGAGAAAAATNNLDATTKTSRELFIGNTPPGTSDVMLQQYLNSAMTGKLDPKVKLTTSPGDPIRQARVNDKFAFVELRSVEETTAMLNMNGIPFMGIMLKIGRPSKYAGPPTPASSWQQLTGVAMEAPAAMGGMGIGMGMGSGIGMGMGGMGNGMGGVGGGVDPSTKVARELFIGNTQPGTVSQDGT